MFANLHVASIDTTLVLTNQNSVYNCRHNPYERLKESSKNALLQEATAPAVVNTS